MSNLESAEIAVLLQAIRNEADTTKTYRFMEFCGGHTYTLAKYALSDVLPVNVKAVHGPGCPVCVIPACKIKQALYLLENYTDIILCSYGDTLRVPDDKGNTLQKCRAKGADVRIVYSCMDALQIAKENPDKRTVFFAVGFETTAPLTAAVILQAQQEGISNFVVFANHLATNPAIDAVLRQADDLDGIIAPGHVLAVTGLASLKPLASKYKVPMCASGFKASDMLASILMLIKQVNNATFKVQNQYVAVVTEQGNPYAVDILKRVFPYKKDFVWRGLGLLPNSAFAFADEYKMFDAESIFALPSFPDAEPKGCICPLIITGKKAPSDCLLFAKICTPQNPIGPCMVSSEGTCGSYFKYKTVL